VTDAEFEAGLRLLEEYRERAAEPLEGFGLPLTPTLAFVARLGSGMTSRSARQWHPHEHGARCEDGGVLAIATTVTARQGRARGQVWLSRA